MNLHLLVEGRRTEMRVYPRWLAHLLPHHSRVDFPDAVARNNYFLFSGEGYPRLLDVTLPNAIADVNASGKYQYLIVCLDADEDSVEDRRDGAARHAAESKPSLDPGVTLKVIVQNRSMETWFLGNRRVFPRHSLGARFREMAAFHDTSILDPEAMGKPDDYATHADFHHDYLREMLAVRGLRYAKTSPGLVADPSYLDALIERTRDEPAHLATFQSFLALCGNIRDLSKPA
ncbi:MAG: hypothetical protein K2W96_25805 [Gemmataceae bacterium]|nr:hypothetical protein [Gemmataceae bacterium]